MKKRQDSVTYARNVIAQNYPMQSGGLLHIVWLGCALKPDRMNDCRVSPCSIPRGCGEMAMNSVLRGNPGFYSHQWLYSEHAASFWNTYLLACLLLYLNIEYDRAWERDPGTPYVTSFSHRVEPCRVCIAFFWKRTHFNELVLIHLESGVRIGKLAVTQKLRSQSCVFVQTPPTHTHHHPHRNVSVSSDRLMFRELEAVE